jgi:hypothetical protein
LIVGLVALLVLRGIVDNVPLRHDVGLLVVVGGSVAAMVYVWVISGRGHRRMVAAEKARCDQELGAIDEQAAALDAQIAAVSANIEEQHAVVNS